LTNNQTKQNKTK